MSRTLLKSSQGSVFLNSRLLWRIVLPLFISILTIELLSLSPLIHYYEKQKLDALEQKGLTALQSLLHAQSTPFNPQEATKLAQELMSVDSSIKGIEMTRSDGTLFIRLGEKPEEATNARSKSTYLIQSLRTDNGTRYDVSWDTAKNNLPFDVVARLDTSDIAHKVHRALLNALILMLIIAVLITGITIFILKNAVFKPILSLKDRLLSVRKESNINEQPLATATATSFSSTEFGDIERTINQLATRLNDAQKTIKAHGSLLQLRVEERLNEISQHANYDPVTELPSRNLLKENLSQLIEQATTENKNVALLLLVLNDYHEINNAYGPDTGTDFLKKVARELTENMPAGTTVARMSSSQFALARGGLTGTHQIANLAQWILDLFTKPFFINEHNLLTSVNVGIAIFPIDGLTTDILISNANLALNRTKNSTPNTFQFYESNMNQLVEARRKMLLDMHYALERNELVAYYQPQVDLKTNKIIGVEALMRWMHPEKGLIPPGLFMSLAEESGLIIPMSEWMLLEACKQGMTWQKQGLPALTMAVNLSGKQFKQKNIVEVISRILMESQLPSHHLEVEITESIIVDNPQEAISIMKALRGLGLSISIDDFGTGYSSLSYLRRFPIQKLKIDQSFVKDLGQPGGHEKSLTDIIILLAKNLNLRVIAEGIETTEQADYLREKGCDEGQGYLFGKPLSTGDIVALFKK